jgi:hypothetical protein
MGVSLLCQSRSRPQGDHRSPRSDTSASTLPPSSSRVAVAPRPGRAPTARRSRMPCRSAASLASARVSGAFARWAIAIDESGLMIAQFTPAKPASLPTARRASLHDRVPAPMPSHPTHPNPRARVESDHIPTPSLPIPTPIPVICPLSPVAQTTPPRSVPSAHFKDFGSRI